jgi:PAS domain S-box-containing protein
MAPDMTIPSRFSSRLRHLLSVLAGTGESLNAPILRLIRIYCVLAVGSGMLLLVAFYLDFRLWDEITLIRTELSRSGPSAFLYLHRFNFFLTLIVLFLVAGAIFYGFRIARQAGADARHSARLLQEAKQRAMEIAALYDTSQDVSAHTDLPALLQTIVERAKSLLGTAGCAIFLVNPEHDDFVIAVEVGVGMPIGTHLSRNEGLGGRVAETLGPVIVNDFPSWPYRSQSLRQLPISAAVCVPMIRGGELIGVLGVHEVAGTDREFTEADARLLSLFADNAAGAVHHARLLEALRNSEERFRIAAQCASDIVYEWDLVADHVEYFGPAAEKARGLGAPLVGTRQKYWEMIHPEDRERVRAALTNHITAGAPFSEEYRIVSENGAHINVADRATAIRNQQGRPVRLVGSVSDITVRKRAEQMKSDFVSFVTHQLRTPLSGIKWMLELAMDGSESPEEAQSYIRDARRSTDRLIGLVNDLLDVSRLERGRLQVTVKEINLADLTQSVVSEISPLMSEKGQKLSVQAAHNLRSVSADPQMLRQAILNLTSNAVKYTPRGGEIKIRIGVDNDRLRWEIKDTGIGIPSGDVGKLFEKFYRARNASDVETEGTGLGLYLVRLIVERFGGNVWCESEEGVGSTFVFALPLAA